MAFELTTQKYRELHSAHFRVGAYMKYKTSASNIYWNCYF